MAPHAAAAAEKVTALEKQLAALGEVHVYQAKAHWDDADIRLFASNRVRPALRASLIVIVLLVVFGSLLRGADPIFASLVELPDMDLGEFISHVFVIGFYTWIVAGWFFG